MEYFPLLVDEAGKMVTDVIRRFVDTEIMPIRDKIDDDHDHTLINELLVKMSALGVFNVNLPEEGAETAGPSLTTSCAVIEEFARGDAGIGLVAGISGWAMAGAVLAGAPAGVMAPGGLALSAMAGPRAMGLRPMKLRPSGMKRLT